MNPLEWVRCADAVELLRFLFPLHGTGSSQEQSRKLRLYFCALARNVWNVLPGPLRATVELGERAADSVEFSRSAIAVGALNAADEFAGWNGHEDDIALWARMLRDLGLSVPPCGPRPSRWTEKEWQGYAQIVALPLWSLRPNYGFQRSLHRSDLIRDIFEYPEEIHLFDPAWRTAEVVAAARAMYRNRNFGGMPLVGDKLEEAGCSDAYFLDHCRTSSVPHVRGCWLVDRILQPDDEFGTRLANDLE